MELCYFTGLGVVIVFLAALSIGRLTVIGVRDARLSERAAEDEAPVTEPVAPVTDPVVYERPVGERVAVGERPVGEHVAGERDRRRAGRGGPGGRGRAATPTAVSPGSQP